MDPFSISVGIISLADITWRVVKYLREFKEAAGIVESEISSLLTEIQSLEAVNKQIKQLHENEIEIIPAGSEKLPARDEELWRIAGTNLKDCEATVKRLYDILDEISGKHGDKVASKWDGIRKQLRKQSKDGELGQIRSQISVNRQSLHISLTMLDLIYTKRGSDHFQQLAFMLQKQMYALQSRLPRLEKEKDSAHSSLESATEVLSSLRLNEHFDPPKTVSPIFTGRKRYLDKLKEAFDHSLSPSENKPTQKRFVVFGLGGSGKTQFCCKFASDNKQRFWAVFTVDASSAETARQSFVAIAKFCGVDANERAAKSWLSSIDRPWLLLIDNADDAKLELERYLPDGEHGLTIITTRNPNIKHYGTIGERFYHFDRLEDAEAGQLLLRAAEHRDPPTPPVGLWAAKIVQALGGLPLALIHAGKAIKAKYCGGFHDYLGYYDARWQEIRDNQRLTRRRKGSISMDEYIKVYSTYEILYRGLEDMAKEYEEFEDALQLLQLFSFFHHENIPFHILIAAVQHPRLEREAQEKAPKEDAILDEKDKPSESVKQPNSWLTYLRETIAERLGMHITNRHPTVLPTFLKDAELSESAENFNVRLRKALDQLTRLSLVTYHDRSDSYSMHPLVHTWVRERPQMTTRRQAVWCEAALTTISRCILLPPLSSTVQTHADVPRQILPHLIAVEQRQENIRAEFLKNQKSSWRPWPPVLTGSGIHPKKALQLARASLVYAECGYFDHAEIRQRAVRDFVYRMRGPEHPRAMDITLALAGTLWFLTRTNEAADLQEEVFENCQKSLGTDHPRTLKVMDALGTGRRQQGKLKESMVLHERAIEGMSKHSDRDPALYHAFENLGVTLWYCYRFEEARDHQEKAVEGLTSILGETDLRTLIAMEALARTYRALGSKYLETDAMLSKLYLQTAHEKQSFVFEQRVKQLGDKQPYTWLARLHLGAIKGAMGDLEEGERLISGLVPIASAHLGEDHLGVMAGKNELARIYIMQERFTEAEHILLEISKPENYKKTATATGDHPDRCDALWTLLDCYTRQAKVEDGLATCDLLESIILAMRKRAGTTGEGTSEIFWGMIEGKRRELMDMMAIGDVSSIREGKELDGGLRRRETRSEGPPPYQE